MMDRENNLRCIISRNVKNVIRFKKIFNISNLISLKIDQVN